MAEKRWYRVYVRERTTVIRTYKIESNKQLDKMAPHDVQYLALTELSNMVLEGSEQLDFEVWVISPFAERCAPHPASKDKKVG